MISSYGLNILLLVLAVLISAVAQIMLKKESVKPHATKTKEYLNFNVIGGYTLFLLAMLISFVVLRVLPLSFLAVSEALGYVFVILLSSLLLKEHVGRKKKLGVCVIIIGVLVFYLF